VQSRFRILFRLIVGSILLAACTPFGFPVFFHPPDGRFEDKEIIESSGIVKSRRIPGLFWTHNDSDNPTRLYAVDQKGGRIGRVDLLGATNVDWEDIAIDDAGFLYLCDIGNNSNRRKSFTIYQIAEVDPRQVHQVEVSARFTFHYPGLRSPDAEACFYHQGNLYILTKEPGNGKTALYRLNTAERAPSQELTFIGETDVENAVTAADLSPDAARLAVLTYSSIYLFFKPDQGDNYLAGPSCHISLLFGQAEGIAWDGNDLIITNEEGQLLRLEEMARPSPRFPPACSNNLR
jgi:hypothetical protein